MNLFEELKWRGLIKDVSNEELAKKLLNDEKITFYCGFDPTADSLTIGHLVQIMRLRFLEQYGHQPIVLIGGGTGLIGDPSGRSSERKLLTLEETLANANKIKTQFKKYLPNAIYVNNYDWLSKINVIEFLRDYGKHFTVNYMLAKDTVATRLEGGISFTEFSYMIIQALDWLHLYKHYNCKLQFGGSEQWGNITAGLELIRKILGDNTEVLGLSSPLLTKADGKKFGKSESGNLWLDENRTSAYALYQYFINTQDKDVINYLKMLTLLSKEEIEVLEQKVINEPELREAQKVLGREIVTFVHGLEAYENALRITEILFNGEVSQLTSNEIEDALSDVFVGEISDNINIVVLLVQTNITSSKREAKELVESNAISVNGNRVNDINYLVTKTNAINHEYTVIRRGKKKYYLIKHI
ncbi:MAG: tyrosine--tRNA ligase [Bacilli bacterium]|jgi:tyrosyl-tRNA synthetase